MISMNKHIKNGIISMIAWILFLVILFGSYLYLTNSPFSYFVDEETGGFISSAFFLGWALIWFGIGRHYSIDYEAKKQVFIESHEGIDRYIIDKAFRKAYFSSGAKVLAIVCFISVPCYVAANVKGEPTLKDCILIGMLMLASIILYAYYKRNRAAGVTL